MKTKFKLFTAIILSFFSLHCAYSQSTISPGNGPQCPGVVVDYSWTASTGGCFYTWTVTNGKFQAVAGGTLNGTQTQITGNNLTNVKIIWDNVPSTFTSPIWTAPFGSINVSTSNCTSGGGSGLNNILIKTLNGITPNAFTNSNFSPAVCVTSPAIAYATAQVRFANTGGPVYTSSIYADGYEWTIPSGWKYADNVGRPLSGNRFY